MRVIEINGSKFSNLTGFYREVEREMTFGLNWKIGKNLNAFNDVLFGGFGVHDVDEKCILKWHNSKKSKTELKDFDRIIEIIKEHDNIELQLT
ncbi:barstar family protein [Marivirga sp. S37H4]|uniref:Barstar family protein n=1 Tax=Marivirga aurantiaca TaxID=2802615 RepID=A0A935C7U5_9BACT|nr:barstar family protein [Marivirga aurantiaca]MBK6265104.1 barstar family protein [Marivirga aurantiaca]